MERESVGGGAAFRDESCCAPLLPFAGEHMEQGARLLWTALVDGLISLVVPTTWFESCSKAAEVVPAQVQVSEEAEEAAEEPPPDAPPPAEPAVSGGGADRPEQRQRLGAEALRTALGGPAVGFLAPRELGPVAAAAAETAERLGAGCGLSARAREPRELERRAAWSASAPARRLHRAELLRELRHSKAAVCMGLGRATVLVKDGRALVSTEASPSPSVWQPLLPPKGSPCEIQSVCLSPGALLALDERGRVLCVGFDQADGGPRWAPVQALEGVEAVSVQSRFGQIYVVARNGDLYAWGLASGDGTPARACSVGLPASPQDIPAPTRITGAPGVDMFGFGRVPLQQVACGAAHAVFLTVEGEAFAVGQGREGQLGNRALGDSSVPVRMALPSGARARAAACGLQHTLLATTDGEALGCGGSASGELPLRRPSPGALPPELAAAGLAAWAFEAVPRRLDLLPPPEDFFVMAVSCGLCSSFFVGDDGGVFMTGSVVCDPTPFGRPWGSEPRVPHRLQNLPRVREVAVSLRVPLKLPGLPFSTLPEATEAQPSELAVFWAADEDRAFAWGSPGGVAPRELKLPSP